MKVRRGVTEAASEARAALELAEQIRQPDAAVALVFASCDYDPQALAAELQRQLEPVPVYGCTSINVLSPQGFQSSCVTGMTLSSPGLSAGAGCAVNLSKGAVSSGRRATLAAIDQLGLAPEDLTRARHVALCFIDWRSQAEEQFLAAVIATAPGMSFVGGSTSDAAPGGASRVFFRGRAHLDAGLVVLFDSKIPFRLIVTEHHRPGHGRVVVTATDPASRLVHELNGKPARQVYRELIGPEIELTNAVAARYPFGYYVEGRAYVRSVMGIEGDSLRFACGVDRGTVLVPMRPGDIIPATEVALADTARELGGRVSAMVAFSCYGRYLETEAAGITGDVGRLLTSYPTVGFSSFGEQVNGVHVNHTLTGLAFGDESDG